MLECTANTEPCNFTRRLIVDTLTQKTHIASGSLQHAGDQVKRCAFTRPVRPDQAHELTGTQCKTDIVNSNEPAKLFTDLVNSLYQRTCLGAGPLRQYRRCGRSFASACSPCASQGPPGRLQNWPYAFPSKLQHQHHQYTE